jgi:hypothetical protein
MCFAVFLEMQPNTEKENMKIFYKQTNEAQDWLSK